jgi:hypothetical protein
MRFRCQKIAAAVLAFSSCAFAQSQQPLPESPGAIEYRSVAEALETLKAKPGVEINELKPSGWVIVNESRSIMWSFTPTGHYAHPAVVRREVVERDGGVVLEMRALCQADKASCDKLIREFQELNERMRQSMRSQIDKR